MDARRQPDEMTDAALDRELQAMLGVGPSADFAARVRTRIADEPARSRSWFGAWWFAVPAAALAVVAIVAAIALFFAGSIPTRQPGSEPSADGRGQPDLAPAEA